METDIEAAAIAAALGAFAGGAIADAALDLDGAVVGVVSVAAAGLASLNKPVPAGHLAVHRQRHALRVDALPPERSRLKRPEAVPADEFDEG